MSLRHRLNNRTLLYGVPASKESKSNMSNSTIRIVVVHNATGQQDECARPEVVCTRADSAGPTRGSVVRALSAASGYVVRAAVRDPDTPKAQALAALPDVKVFKVDADSAQTLAAAYAGADAVSRTRASASRR